MSMELTASAGCPVPHTRIGMPMPHEHLGFLIKSPIDLFHTIKKPSNYLILLILNNLSAGRGGRTPMAARAGGF